MKKVIKLFLVLVLCMITLTGCLLSKEEKQKEQQVKAKAEEIANSYILRKYNISDAEISKISVNTRDDTLWGPLGAHFTNKATVKYIHKDESFSVYVDTSDESLSTTYTSDTYQNSKIEEALTAYMEKIFSTKSSYTKISVSKAFKEDEYFNDNLEEFMSKINFNTTLLFEGKEKNKDILLNKLKAGTDKILKKCPSSYIKIGIYNSDIIPAEELSNFLIRYNDNKTINSIFYEIFKSSSENNEITTEVYNYCDYLKFDNLINIPHCSFNVDDTNINKLYFEKGEEKYSFFGKDEHEYYSFERKMGWAPRSYDQLYLWVKIDTEDFNGKDIAIVEYYNRADTEIKFENVDNKIYFRMTPNTKYKVLIKE